MGRLRRLPAYDYNQMGYYFLTFCTKERVCILSRIVGRDDLGAPVAVLTSLGKTLDTYIRTIPSAYQNVSLHRYVIMPNHVHLLLSIDVESMAGAPRSSRPTQLVPRIIAAIKRFTNQSEGKNIWQSTFHDHVIRSEADYLRIWDYIETNPAKWREDCYFTQGSG